jgi:hypothetical protein
MDIQEFIRESLCQIMEGVHAASIARPGITPDRLRLSDGHKPPPGAFVIGPGALCFVVEKPKRQVFGSCFLPMIRQ